MSNTNQAEANLLAAEDRIETAFTGLKAAVLSEVKDATDEIAKFLSQAVVSPATAKAVTDRLNTLAGNVEGLTPTVAAADPGPQALDGGTPVTTPPATQPPASTPPAGNPPATQPTDGGAVGGSTVDTTPPQ